MKYRISFLLTLSLLLASCQQELPPVAGGGTTGRGHISFNVAPMKSGNTNPLENKDFATRAFIEDAVNRVDAVVFEVGGGLLGIFSQNTANANDFSTPFTGCGGKTCNIYFIANLKAAPTNITSETAFKLSNCGLDTYSQQDVTTYGIPMCGSLLGFKMPSDGIITNTPITLARLLARVDILYRNAIPTQFTANSLELCNVPNITPYYSDVTTDPATYYTPVMPVSNFVGKSGSISDATYYLPANRRGIDWTNSNPRTKLGKDITTPTYVKITGPRGIFTFYLGSNDFNDYNILANTQYTITANIEGLSMADGRVCSFEPESNCYIVKPGSTINIPVSRAVAGNAAAGYVLAGSATLFKAGDPFNTSLLWSDVSTTHVTPTVFGDYIKVVAGNTEGNSVICATTGTALNEVVVWSWHIWVTNYEPSTAPAPSPAPAGLVYVSGGTLPYYNSLYWLDRNIGATTSTPNTPTTLGLFYQWGRKDPFPPASTTTDITTGKTIYLPKAITYPAPLGAIALSSDPNMTFKSFTTPISVANASSYSIKFPLMFLGTGWSGSIARAVGTNSTTGGVGSWAASTKKSFFDPCPVGWCVPANASWEEFYIATNASYKNTVANWSINGMQVSSVINATYYPAMGKRGPTNGKLVDVGGVGNYWSKSKISTSCYGLGFAEFGINGDADINVAANGYPVRCVQEL